MHQPQIEDLQFHIHQMKKINLDLQSENQLLKVNVRKLSTELNKKNKQLDAIIDPKKNGNISKILSKHGASLIVKVKEENLNLHKKLAEKDLHIKKLQSDMETTRLYVNEKTKITSPSLKLFEHQELLEKIEDLSNGSYYKAPSQKMGIRMRSKSVINEKKMLPRSRSRSPKTKKTPSTTDLQTNYMKLINNNLQKIRQFGGFNGDRTNRSINSICSNKSDTPHEEIQQLQSYLLNVLNEVDSLKDTINKLQQEQSKTTSALNNKNSDINKLVSRMENCAKKKFKDRRRETESESEHISSDGLSSKCSTCDYTEESDYNETTEGSTVESETKITHRENETNTSGTKVHSSKSISIQTARSFCSRPFTAGSKKTIKESDDQEISTDEYGIEIEYID